MTFSIEDIESVGESIHPLEGSGRILDAPKLPLVTMFYPFGFPVEIRTNSNDVLEQYRELWGKFKKQHDTDPIRCDVQFVPVSSTECPPEPTHRLMLPWMVCTADADNYSVADLEHGEAKIAVSSAALRYPLYLKYFLLPTPVYCCVATCRATPVHAACVALDGRGVLLCGDSGAGKSTLAYACARAGWTYVADDACYILNDAKQRLVTGNCHQVRFRPSSAALFPEVAGREITPRAAGKPSIELPTSEMTQIECAQTSCVDFVVFLNRNRNQPTQLARYSKDAARRSMQRVLYGPSKSLVAQHEAIERLLTAQVFELRYSDLHWAADRLRALMQEGH